MSKVLLGAFISFLLVQRNIAFNLVVRKYHRKLQRASSNTSSLFLATYESDQDSQRIDIEYNLLWHMTRFFGEDMVDPTTNRFYYFCFPTTGERQHVNFPIRDLAAAWDATKALEFALQTTKPNDDLIDRIQLPLTNAIRTTLKVYQSGRSNTCLDSDILQEPPNIGHSALMLLACANAIWLGIIQSENFHDTMDKLTRGILSMQMVNGAFSTDFGKREDFWSGIEFFPGEAMLALMTIHDMEATIIETSTRENIIPAMDKAFDFYMNYFKTTDVDANYNIWQVLAFSKFYSAIDDDNMLRKHQISEYILELCQGICQSHSWKYQLSRGKSFWVNLKTVEIACGLDAIAEGIRIARDENDEHLARLFQLQATNAKYFLEWSQDQISDDCIPGKGGLGYGGVQILEQRLDITGHAISAVAKLRKLSLEGRK